MLNINIKYLPCVAQEDLGKLPKILWQGLSNAILPNDLIFQYARYLDFDLILWHNLFPEYSYNNYNHVYEKVNEELLCFYQHNKKDLKSEIKFSHNGLITLYEPECLVSYRSPVTDYYGRAYRVYDISDFSYQRKTKSFHPYYTERSGRYEF